MGKSTLNRLGLSGLQPTRYHKVSHVPIAIKRLFVDLFLEAHERALETILLDLDAMDDPLHGDHEGRFFHGCYDGYRKSLTSTMLTSGSPKMKPDLGRDDG